MAKPLDIPSTSKTTSDLNDATGLPSAGIYLESPTNAFNIEVSPPSCN